LGTRKEEGFSRKFSRGRRKDEGGRRNDTEILKTIIILEYGMKE